MRVVINPPLTEEEVTKFLDTVNAFGTARKETNFIEIQLNSDLTVGEAGKLTKEVKALGIRGTPNVIKKLLKDGG